MSPDIIEKYSKIRARYPFMPASSAFRWAKHPDAAEGWEANTHGDVWTKEVDGFEIRLTVEDESIFPIPDKKGDTDYGRYAGEAHRRYNDDYDWDGQWARPEELACFSLVETTGSKPRRREIIFPYTAIHYSGPGWTQSEGSGYFIPDGIKDEYESYRRRGASRSVAWDMTYQFIESQIKMLFSSPLTNCCVWVKAYRKGVDIELGSACMGTDVSGDDEGRAYIFEMVNDYGMISEAIEEAKTAIVKIVGE